MQTEYSPLVSMHRGSLISGILSRLIILGGSAIMKLSHYVTLQLSRLYDVPLSTLYRRVKFHIII
jgi:hypothetical protein